ncbi:hypothetical protein [Nocardia sp. NPDC049149]|uniref:hypothetical protein n=1 Tax=Nocardia sp. NPDC049149 TaxID=3364315 RepID=UPI0037161187
MPLHYVRVKTQLDNFSPVIRPTGNLVVIGDATVGVGDVAVEVTTPDQALKAFSSNPLTASPLSKALVTAMRQTPGPRRIWGIRQGTVAASLAAAEGLNVQFVVLANTSLSVPGDSDPKKAQVAAIRSLVTHVNSVSLRGDGNERMGVAMLEKGLADPKVVAGDLVSDRMVYVAHQSDDDAAAAVAATIAGYPPHTSMILKPVSITNTSFTSVQIDALNGEEVEDSPKPLVGGAGVVWLTSPALLPGSGTYLGEGYNANPTGQIKFIDVQRTIDDITFKLKARLIGSIGNLRISRSGLRALIVTLESELNPLVAAGVLEGFRLNIPVLNLLDADPATLTDTQIRAVKDAHENRVAQVLVSVEYAGAMHRININLKFN